MICSLHTHTFRCNHASGTERDYIETAVKAGMKVLGFSDHSPYVFDGDYYSGFRMRPELQKDYVETLLALREEYKGVIDIKIGYEAEYYPKYFSRFIKMIEEYPVDYLILGQHFLDNETEGRYSGVQTEDPSYLRDYVNQVCEGIKTGYYTYVAHPDLVNFIGKSEAFDSEYSRLIECAKDNGIPLEINCLGIYGHRAYPHRRFFELCGEIGASVCIGCDAHSPDKTADAESFGTALRWVNEFGLDFIEVPVLRALK